MFMLTLTNGVYLYFILAIGYNVVSQLAADSGRRALAPTEPSFGILMMSVLFLIWSCISLMPLAGWAALMAVYIYLILRFGIFKHLTGYGDELYASRLSWRCAIGINVFGVAILASDLGARLAGAA